MKKLLPVFAASCLFQLASAAPIYYFTNLNAASENPPNASTATGTAEVIFDSAADTMRVVVVFSGLTGPITGAHIHCCVAAPGNVGIASTAGGVFPGFPAGTSGVYDQTLSTAQATTFRAAFGGGTVAGAEAALAAGLGNGQAYLNLHTSANPGGEIRGFLQTAPEPGTFVLLSGALGAIVLLRRRK